MSIVYFSMVNQL